MLATEQFRLDGALDELAERIADIEDAMDDLDEDSDDYEAADERRERLEYLANGLRWQRDEEGWGGDATVGLGAMTAAEKGLMHREAPDDAGREEMRLWFVAASTAAAPYASGDLTETFHGVGACHPAFAQWAEAKANGLGVPGESGNGSATSSPATSDSGTSTDEPDSTTSSPSGSPTG